ncbi:unnamed protein product [Prorocentrum cordatum]|uniref:Uncharacterized protein n=1 Tax=Prorocentrum cordatum TaxID=2364126 RepID=A0ABN9W388_9DINO|nr:unnamed protein product [Polarella glacialis]
MHRGRPGPADAGLPDAGPERRVRCLPWRARRAQRHPALQGPRGRGRAGRRRGRPGPGRPPCPLPRRLWPITSGWTGSATRRSGGRPRAPGPRAPRAPSGATRPAAWPAAPRACCCWAPARPGRWWPGGRGPCSCWARRPPRPLEARRGCGACALPDGTVLLYGGRALADGRVFDDMWAVHTGAKTDFFLQVQREISFLGKMRRRVDRLRQQDTSSSSDSVGAGPAGAAGGGAGGPGLAEDLLADLAGSGGESAAGLARGGYGGGSSDEDDSDE